MPSLMFVCTANLCRSPVAAALFRQWLQRHAVSGDWQVLSSGTWADDGKEIARSVQTAMRELDIDLSQHRSRTISEELLHGVDLILCMTQSHREALRVEFPQYAPRIRLLSEMTGQTYDIPDMERGSSSDCVCLAKDLVDIIEQGGENIAALLLQTKNTV